MTQFRIGQIVRAEIVEAIQDGYWIVSFAGDLFRVFDASYSHWERGEQIELEVIAVDPFRLRIVGSESGLSKIV